MSSICGIHVMSIRVQRCIERAPVVMVEGCGRHNAHGCLAATLLLIASRRFFSFAAGYWIMSTGNHLMTTLRFGALKTSLILWPYLKPQEYNDMPGFDRARVQQRARIYCVQCARRADAVRTPYNIAK